MANVRFAPAAVVASMSVLGTKRTFAALQQFVRYWVHNGHCPATADHLDMSMRSIWDAQTGCRTDLADILWHRSRDTL